MTIDLDDLEAKAKATTQGEWASGDNQLAVVCEKCDAIGCAECHQRGIDDLLDPRKGQFFSCHDAEFCAAAQPSTVLAMIARIRELEHRLANSFSVGKVGSGSTSETPKAYQDLLDRPIGSDS